MKLRDYQIDVLKKIKESWKSGHRAPLLVLPTGAGKTYTFMYIVKQLEAANRKVWVVVHRENLAIQTGDAARTLGIPFSIIGAGHSENMFYNFQIAKVASVPGRFNRLSSPDVIIVDEAHHSTAGQWAKIIKQYPNAKILGVTATPERLDGKALGVNSGGFFDDLIVGPTMRELCEKGFLSNPKYFTFGNLDTEKIHITSGGDFDTKESGAELNRPKILNDTVARYRATCDGQPAIAFCCTVKHAEDVADEFNAFGYNAIALVGKMDFREQQNILEGLSSGKYDVVTSCEIISEGTDIPDVSAAILLRPTWSLTLYLQQVGRALRVAKDNRPKYIIDMVGNIYRHGHPLMDRDWKIDGERQTPKKKKQERDNYDIKTCPECLLTFESREAKDGKCPYCGSVIGSKQRRINIVDGELVEIVWDEIEKDLVEWHKKQDELLEKRQNKKDYWKSIYSCKSLEELESLAKEKGYKNGWAWMTWKRIKNGAKKRLSRTEACICDTQMFNK